MALDGILRFRRTGGKFLAPVQSPLQHGMSLQASELFGSLGLDRAGLVPLVLPIHGPVVAVGPGLFATAFHWR